MKSVKTKVFLLSFFLCPIILCAQTRQLHTESDGFQWYQCSQKKPCYVNEVCMSSWVELKNGKKITETLYGIDWSKSGYIVSHKVFYLQHSVCPPGVLGAPGPGGIYTLDGDNLVKDDYSPFSFSFYDHGIIISSKHDMSGVYYNGKVIVPFKYGEIKYADSCYIASCSYKYKCKGYYIYSLDGELIGNDYSKIYDFDNTSTPSVKTKFMIGAIIKKENGLDEFYTRDEIIEKYNNIKNSTL